MTPERQKWWDSLTKEEKCVRIAIKKEKSYMSFYKSDGALNIRGFIKYHKLLIKALRKQIAMRPAIKKEFVMFRFCPTCDCILNVSKARPFCDKCGQKLRWK